MKIDVAYCDLHPVHRMEETAFAIPSRRTFTDEKALRCTKAGCNRYYHYDFGYFPFVAGQEPEFGNLAGKPSCRIKHDLLYMLLTEQNGVLTYACFFPECPSTVAFKTK